MIDRQTDTEICRDASSYSQKKKMKDRICRQDERWTDTEICRDALSWSQIKKIEERGNQRSERIG